MRALYWLLILAVGQALAVFAASNRVEGALGGWSLPFLVEIPLYLIVLGAVLLGFVIGELTAWPAAGRWRREVRRRGWRIAALERELAATQSRLLPQAVPPARS